MCDIYKKRTGFKWIYKRKWKNQSKISGNYSVP